jgi:uncharacterized tellurite resistance protein B-like protein
MLDRLMKLFNADSSTTAVPVLADDEVRLAAGALLVHAMRIDGTAAEAEHAKMKETLTQRFELADEELAELIEASQDADSNANDLYQFTSKLTRHLDQPGRQRIVEMLWEVVYADDVLDAYEDNLVWRVAELLGVSTRDRMDLKKQVRARRQQNGDA